MDHPFNPDPDFDKDQFSPDNQDGHDGSGDAGEGESADDLSHLLDDDFVARFNDMAGRLGSSDADATTADPDVNPNATDDHTHDSEASFQAGQPGEADSAHTSGEDSSHPSLDDIFSQLGITPPTDGMQFAFPLPNGVDPDSFIEQITSMMSNLMNQSSQPQPPTVDWQQTKTMIRHAVAAKGEDPTPKASHRAEVADAERLANTWLNEVTCFPAPGEPTQVWSRAHWVEATSDAWCEIAKPVIESLATASKGLVSGSDLDMPGLDEISKLVSPLMQHSFAQIYTAQIAEAIASLAGTTLTGTEIGLQILNRPAVALLPTNYEQVIKDFNVDRNDLLIYLILRESARQRLFGSVGWLGTQILALVQHYAAEVQFDPSTLTDFMAGFETSSPNAFDFSSLTGDLKGKLFSPTLTDEQKGILCRLETLLALAEGWIDTVTSKVVTKWMPHTDALGELIRRRRITDAGTDSVLKELVGLELHPRRVRDAFNLWNALDEARGSDGRDQVWHHPDLIPTAADLDDPLGFVSGDTAPSSNDEWDAELARLLEEEGNEG